MINSFVANEGCIERSSAWFAGPKSENGEAFATVIQQILSDYQYWRRNYFPEDGVIVDSAMRRGNESFQDRFDDRLMELLAQLKGDLPFHSPRYAAHMVSEQTLPAIAGYFAAMLYNPNNVSLESAPVTVRLELEAARMIARMIGHDDDSWAHLTGGGTLANIESLWIARTVRYLPLVVKDMAGELGVTLPDLPSSSEGALRISPLRALEMLNEVFEQSQNPKQAIAAYRRSPHNVAEFGLASVCARVGGEPVLFVPETYHYSLSKVLDVLGIGRRLLVRIPVDRHFRMDIKALRFGLEEAESSGRHIMAVVAVMGTTEEGAIDPLDQILDLRAERESQAKQSFWVHADAAYGGYLRTTMLPARIGLGPKTIETLVSGERKAIAIQLPEGHNCDALARLGECDSVTIDPHKMGYIPYPAGAVSFKSGFVKAIARQDAPYIGEAPGSPAEERDSGSVGLYMIEGSKPGAAAAAVWMSHSLIPLDTSGLGSVIRETVRSAAEFAALFESWNDIHPEASVRGEILCPPGSNIVCYSFKPTQGAGAEEVNRLNQEVYRRFSLSGQHVYEQRFFISRTVLTSQQYSWRTVSDFVGRLGLSQDDFERDGVFVLRSVLMNPWYGIAKEKGRFYVSELVSDLYAEAERIQRARSSKFGP